MTSVLRRVGIIGDVHGEDKTLETALAFLKADNTLDALLCTGDLPAKHRIGSAERCNRLLSDARVYVVRGNHDRWTAEQEGGYNVRSFPPVIIWSTPHGDGMLCHGIDKDDMAGIYPGGEDRDVVRALESYGIASRYRYVVAGHTHRRMIRCLPEAGLTWINPGSLCWDEEPGILIADFAAETAHFHDIDFVTGAIHPGCKFALSALLTYLKNFKDKQCLNHYSFAPMKCDVVAPSSLCPSRSTSIAEPSRRRRSATPGKT